MGGELIIKDNLNYEKPMKNIKQVTQEKFNELNSKNTYLKTEPEESPRNHLKRKQMKKKHKISIKAKNIQKK